MSPLRMGSARVLGVTAAQLSERTDALSFALEAGGGELDVHAVGRARAVVDKVRDRTGLTGDHTVVALAGATGSGKSSLFNAIAGATVATIGARRPTTSTPSAAVWGSADAGPLLDWLKVGARHHVDPAVGTTPVGSLDGLVLLDLPDFDSRETSNRAEAERVLDLVDVFVWVTDPQKYADARMHDDYVAALATHDAVTLVVLNQVDRLSHGQAGQCVADLLRLLELDGVRAPKVVATSAATGIGLDDLRTRLANAVAGRNAARTRLAADVTASSGALSRGVGEREPSMPTSTRTELVDAFARAAGLPTVVTAVERDYRHEAVGLTGWPFTRWVRALRPRPLRRLRLEQAVPGVTEADIRSVTGRSSLPPPSPAARAAVDLATRRLGDGAAEGLPVAWADAVHDASAPATGELSDALDQAVVATPLRAPSPLWWKLVGFVHLILAAVAVVGGLWLVLLMVLGALQLPDFYTPRWGWFPVPLVMLAGGLLLGMLLALVARFLAGIGARRRGRVIGRRLRGAIDSVAQKRVIEPVEAVLERHERTRTLLARAAGGS